MQVAADRTEAAAAIRTDLAAIFVSLELSRSKWLVMSLSPGGNAKISKFVVRGGDMPREGVESHVVDPASIATSRRRRHAKTDRIDGETLVRALLAHKRGEPRVCAMLRVPTPDEEDRRRWCVNARR